MKKIKSDSRSFGIFIDLQSMRMLMNSFENGRLPLHNVYLYNFNFGLGNIVNNIDH